MPSEFPKTTKRSSLLVVAVLFAVVAIGGSAIVYRLSAWSAPAQARKLQNPVTATSESIAAAQAIYAQRCASCHGGKGDGKGEKAGDLSIEPTNFTNGQEMTGTSDGELFWKISEGHRPMPRFKGKLSEDERWELVNYIRTFSAKPAAGKSP